MKVYMKPDENAAGVTVEDDGIALTINVPNCEPLPNWIPLNDVAARAVVEGLLRRMLENGHDVIDIAAGVQSRWREGR